MYLPMISPRLRPTSAASVELACCTTPEASTVRKPHGAASRTGSRCGGLVRSSGSCGTREVAPHGIDGLYRMAEVWAVTCRGELTERTPGGLLRDELPAPLRRDRITPAL